MHFIITLDFSIISNAINFRRGSRGGETLIGMAERQINDKSTYDNPTYEDFWYSNNVTEKDVDTDSMMQEKDRAGSTEDVNPENEEQGVEVSQVKVDGDTWTHL